MKQYNNLLINYFPLVIIISCFLLLKITNLGIRMSDTNIYWYTAYQLVQGQTLYKDIFFTNFPLFPYVSTLYFFLVGKNLSFYFFTSVIEVSAVAGIIYYLSLQKTKSLLISTFSTLLYLFSFIVLATTDHQTGVFLASLFAILSYFFFEKKNYFITGIFVGLMLMTKAYFLPIAATYGVYFLLQQRRALLPFLLSLLFTTFIVLLPTILFAFPEFINNVFAYSLTRSQGIDKANIIRFFISHDIVLSGLFVIPLFTVHKYKFFGLLSIFSLGFIILYQDIYFLYLNFFIPFLCIFFIYFYKDVLAKLSIQKFVIPSILCLFLLFNLFTYMSSFRSLQKYQNLPQMIATIKQVKPQFLYGTNDTAPALSYLTGAPLLNNVVDTNENIFRKGYLSEKSLTYDAIAKNALFIGHGVSYPQAGIEETLLNEIFDESQMQNCKLAGSFPIISEGFTNRINFVSCVKE